MSGRKSSVPSLALLLSLAIASGARSEGQEALLRKLPIQAKLQRRIDCNFQGETLSAVLQFFRQTLAMNVVLDDPAWRLGETPITLVMRDVPAGRALAWALRQAGLQYVVVDNILYAADRRRAAALEPPSFRQYNVADLLGPVF